MPRKFRGGLLASQSGRIQTSRRYLPLSLFALAALAATRRLPPIRGGSPLASGGRSAADSPPAPAGAPGAPPGGGPGRERMGGGEVGSSPGGLRDLTWLLLGRRVEVMVAGRTGPIVGTIAGQIGSLLLLSEDASPTYIDQARVVAVRRLPRNEWGEDLADLYAPTTAELEGDPAEEEDWEMAEAEQESERKGGGWEGEWEGEREDEWESGQPRGPAANGAAGADASFAPAAPTPPPEPLSPAGTPGTPPPEPEGSAEPGGSGAPPGIAGAGPAPPLAYAPTCGEHWQLIHVYRSPRRRVGG
ncbi:MAG: hypothetical protein L6E13_00940 [Firmicutes bacterium]|nr:hypothetical protein [Bacillota bacterium]